MYYFWYSYVPFWQMLTFMVELFNVQGTVVTLILSGVYSLSNRAQIYKIKIVIRTIKGFLAYPHRRTLCGSWWKLPRAPKHQLLRPSHQMHTSELPFLVWLHKRSPVSLFQERCSIPFLDSTYGVLELLLVCPLSWDNFDLGDPSSSRCPSQHSSQDNTDTQTPPSR